ncbi:MAG: hypothetical protein AB1644_09175 [Candidatus Zixiibacteriota bacterium]
MKARTAGLGYGLALASALLAVLTGCSERDRGGNQMPYKGISQTIQEAKGPDDPALDSLATSIVERSLKDPSEVVQLAHVDAVGTRQKASTVLLRLGVLGLPSLLDALATQKPDDYVWDMQTAVTSHLEMQVRLAKLLEEMLKDTRPQTPPNPFAFPDEKPAPRRVCDDAYLLMRQLLSLDETDDERFMNENAFLKMDESEKDAEIKRLLKSNRWINLMESETSQ